MDQGLFWSEKACFQNFSAVYSSGGVPAVSVASVVNESVIQMRHPVSNLLQNALSSLILFDRVCVHSIHLHFMERVLQRQHFRLRYIFTRSFCR